MKVIIEESAEVAENVSNEKQEWQNPEIIKHQLRPVPALPLSIIPVPFRAWIADMSHRMQCPPDIAAATAIVMVGSIIGTGCGIRPKRRDEWLLIPNLFGAAVGRPGIVMKSPTIAEMLTPLNKLEAEAKEIFDVDMKKHSIDLECLKVERETIKRSAVKNKAGASIDDLKAKLTSLDEPIAPIWRRYRTNDATTEKLSELLNENPRGLLVFRDELLGFLNSWEKQGHEQDRAFFLEGWNGLGDNYTDRIGRGTVYTKNMCISIFGSIQPEKLQQYLYKMTDDGMFQRFQVLVYPDEPENWNLIDQLVNGEAKQRASFITKVLSTMDFKLIGAEFKEGDKTPYLHFINDAQEFFYEWLTDLEKKIRSKEDELISEHLAKYRKLMPALALVFHLIDVADGEVTGAISLDATERAAAYCDYLEEHARRIYDLGKSLYIQAAESLCRKISRGEIEDKFVTRDIHRNKWRYLTDIEVVKAACEMLATKGWLRREEISPGFQQRSKTIYHINPKARGFYG